MMPRTRIVAAAAIASLFLLGVAITAQPPFAGAVSLSVCQLTYECISGTPRGYYVHELMLGAFLTLAYFFAGSIARDAFARPGPGARQAAQSASP